MKSDEFRVSRRHLLTPNADFQNPSHMWHFSIFWLRRGKARKSSGSAMTLRVSTWKRKFEDQDATVIQAEIESAFICHGHFATRPPFRMFKDLQYKYPESG